MKDRWEVSHDFLGNFRVNITWFLPFSLASLTVWSCVVGLKDHPAQVKI